MSSEQHQRRLSHSEGDPDSVQPAPPPIVKKLLEAGDVTARELASQQALGGVEPDEIVPTAEGIRFFRGDRLREHKESGAKDSLLKMRLDRIKHRSEPSN